MVAVIVACEIGFWVLLGLGLAARYLLRARALSTALLLAVPLVDVVLLVVAALDLRGGGEAGPQHGLAAVYIGVSLAFGHQLMSWADQRFAHRFAGGPAPVRPPRTGRAHAARERRQWLRHLLAYAVAAAVLAVFTLFVGDVARTVPLWSVMAPWAIVLVVDFIWAFSYTVSPRRGPTAG
ncbi:hypothetical protein [Actinoplanes friuliensis]|uniref:2TM domain-containing protein n=1 Tax=Actinoplanes friuliensis DSM 7358 TaxID=1246995 RepID=U5VZ90_9ACTN|nr:hypothetical protein [Actinoplanes friuliensis]AGZ42189.1 hypothetical protein AFR_19585 [Actinoplanes friuliensis DSM 7358]